MKATNYILKKPWTVRATRTINGFTVKKGYYEYMGATVFPNGVNFAIHTHHGTSVELLLFHRGEKDPYGIIPIPETYRVGDVYAITVFNLDTEDVEYAYRVDGPYDAEKGLLFDRKKILLDPYAKMIAGQKTWGEKSDGVYHARIISDRFDWGEDFQSSRPLRDLVIYELHVRGFTKHASSKVNHPGTFEAIKQKIPYLKELGINAVEMMPIFEFDECINEREHEGNRLLECWGYNTVGFFAPNSSYIAVDQKNGEGWELKELIRELHRNGIEVILDVVFNHTAEGNEDGQFFSFKGLDNNIYYLLTPEGDYYNFSGCGNTMNCNHPIVQNMIVECLRYWVVNFHVDGFRFDLASILGRNEDGSPMTNPPLLRELAYDPVLAKTKLIAEAWDAGGLYQVGSFPASKRWAEWNGRYRDTLRAYMRGDYWRAGDAIKNIFGSADLYGEFDKDNRTDYAGYDSCVNFFTCHDGFTLHDLYAYDVKHNEANGWNNTDGANDNNSWNCGIEGDTDDPEILELRRRMRLNAFTVLMCSRGTPMFLAGDEFGNTQYGNNNAYCQDNEIAWLDWNDLKKNSDQFEFFKYMIRFRKKHPVISRHMSNALCGLPSMSAFGNDGKPLPKDITETAVLGICFAGYNRETKKDDVVFLAMNVNWQTERIELPTLNVRCKWMLSVNTGGNEYGECFYPKRTGAAVTKEFYMKPRSVAVFVAKFM